MKMPDDVILHYSSLISLKLHGDKILLAPGMYLALSNGMLLHAGEWPGPIPIGTTDLWLPPAVINEIRAKA